MIKAEYAVYKGEEFLDIGTARELAEKFNVKEDTVYYWATNTNKKRVGKNGKVAVKLNE